MRILGPSVTAPVTAVQATRGLDAGAGGPWQGLLSVLAAYTVAALVLGCRAGGPRRLTAAEAPQAGGQYS